MPNGKYEYCDDGITFQPLLDDDGPIKEMLRWLFKSNVMFVPGSEIVFQEELRYIVQKDLITQKPIWEARVDYFDVRQQVYSYVIFRLHQPS